MVQISIFKRQFVLLVRYKPQPGGFILALSLGRLLSVLWLKYFERLEGRL